MTKFWAADLKISEIRSELRSMLEDADEADNAKDALDYLRGRKAGRYNFVELAWHAPQHIQNAIQEAGRRVLSYPEF